MPVGVRLATHGHICPPTYPPADAYPVVKRWSREEFYELVRDGYLQNEPGIEMIDGKILTMGTKTPAHANAAVKLRRQLAPLENSARYLRLFAPLSIGPPDRASEPEPDAALVAGTPEELSDDHPATALLVVEVSDANLVYDRDQKARLYAWAGIPEYWITDLLHAVIEVRREPTSDGQDPLAGRYQALRTCQLGDTFSPAAAPEFELRASDFFPRSICESRQLGAA